MHLLNEGRRCRRTRLFRAPGAIATGTLVACLAVLPAQAQVSRSFTNLGFEQPNLTTAGCRVYINQSQVPGWNTTHQSAGTENSGGCIVAGGLGATPGPIIEMWRTPRNNSSGGNVNAPEGIQIAELNAAVASRMFQNVCLVNGELVRWRFSHRGRASATVRDIAEMKVGASATIVRVGTTNSGAFDPPLASLGAVNAAPVAGNTTWINYTGEFIYPNATGLTNIGFEAISASGGATNGNLLDNIQIELAPLVEFTQPSSSSPETNPGINLPTFRVNGTFFAPRTITVLITGGTATLGVDYTTPGNSPVININVPAGTYDGVSPGSLFVLPVAIVEDTDVEGNETIEFEIQPDVVAPAGYQLGSSNVCGGAAQTTWSFTIIDNDARISVQKDSLSLTQVPGDLTRYDLVHRVTVTNTAGIAAEYALTDTPAFDADVTIETASYTRTGPGTGGSAAAGTLTPGAPPWTLTTARSLPAGQANVFTVTTRIRIAPGLGGDDSCSSPASPSSGLFNSASATVTGLAGTFEADSCRNTPTPVWMTVRKQLVGRAAATDQFQVRLFAGGIQDSSATTSGAAVPSSASTGQRIVPAGATLQFEEALKANGTGPDAFPGAYATAVTCTNSSVGSTTVLPSGSGVALSTRRQWPEFAPSPGDEIDCVITNAPGGADLRITKTNTPVSGPVDLADDVVEAGSAVNYSVVVTNLGPAAVNGAVVADTPVSGLDCPATNVVTCASTAAPSACPAGPITFSDLNAGVTLGNLPATAGANSVTFTFTCSVEP
jgi:uncharacterized repeat protein (TIGR01451 family)